MGRLTGAAVLMGLGTAFAARLTDAAIMFGLGVFLAQAWQAEQFGTYRSLLAVVAIAVSWIGFGFEASLYRYGAEQFSRGTGGGLWVLFRILLSARVLVVALVIAALLPLRDEPFFRSVLGGGLSDALLVSVIGYFVGSALIALVGGALFSALAESHHFNAMMTVARMAFAGATLVGVGWFGWAIADVIAANAVMLLAVVAACLLRTWRWARKLPAAAPSDLPWRRLRRYTLISFVSTLSGGLINRQIEQVVVAGFLSAREAGFYAVAVLLAGVVLQLNPGILARGIIQPFLMKDKVGDAAAVRQRLEQVHAILTASCLAFVLPILCIMVMAGQDLIGWTFGAAYQGAYPVVLVLLLAAAVVSLTNAYGFLWQHAERPEIPMYAALCTLAGLAVGVALLKVMGPTGVAVGALVDAVLRLVYYRLAAVRVVRVCPASPLRGIFRLALNCGLVLVLPLALASGAGAPVGALMVVAVCGSLGYGVMVLLNSPFDGEAADIIRRALPWRLGQHFNRLRIGGGHAGANTA